MTPTATSTSPLLLYAQQNDSGEFPLPLGADSFSNIKFSIMAVPEIHCIPGFMLFSHMNRLFPADTGC